MTHACHWTRNFTGMWPRNVHDIFKRPYTRSRHHGPLLLTKTWIPKWMSNCVHCQVWEEINFPFPYFTGATVEVWEWISNSPHTPLGTWLLMLWLKLAHVSEMAKAVHTRDNDECKIQTDLMNSQRPFVPHLAPQTYGRVVTEILVMYLLRRAYYLRRRTHQLLHMR